ncbi:MAG: serine/threonine-protein kinase [Kofleriaceae bacterium]
MSHKFGSVIAERYRLDGELGDGGSATVYRATDLQLGREVALKLLRRTNMIPEIAVRFEREARVGAALGHPHVVQTLDFGRTEGTLFLVTQIVEGGDLHRFHAANAPLSIETVVTIGSQIAQALTAAHAIGLVHRDLKPDNVLVDRDRGRNHDAPYVRVADFGLAFIDESHDPRQGRLTTDGMVSGTPSYMAPEQVSDGVIGPPADIYAFGCLLYELLLGEPPFVGAHGKVFADHLYAPPRPPRLARADIPGGLDELVLRMLAKAAADRPTAEVVHRRLLAFSVPVATKHGRSQDARTSRAERMLTLPPPLASLEPLSRAARAVRIGIAGDPPLDLLAALEVAELDVVSAEEPCEAVIALDATVDRLAELVALKIPVIADVSPRDFERVTALLRLGIAEVVMRPLVPALVVSKLQRALRRRTEKT